MHIHVWVNNLSNTNIPLINCATSYYREEREKYYYHRGKAKDAVTSKNCMCIILDGMAQSKLLLPALLNQAKTYASAWRLKTHLTGLSSLVHLFINIIFGIYCMLL